MKPEEKAKSLVDKYYNISIDNKFNTIGITHSKEVIKQCALECVDEIYSVINGVKMNDYWQEVRNEIEKL